MIGNIIWLAVACVPFYFGGRLPAPTLVFVVAGSFLGYRGRPVPMAKQLMLPGLVVGIVGTGLIAMVAHQFGYLYMVRLVEMLWWSAWFAFCWAPLIISTVLHVRGIPARGPG